MSLKPILYAEDEENDAFFLERAFQAVGIQHPLVVATDGQDAIDYCSGGGRYADRTQHPSPYMVLLDLNMPRRSGIEVLQWIRKQPTVAKLPVLILTSSLQDSDIDLAYTEGANAYLVKPSHPDELVTMTQAIKDFWLLQNRTTTKPEDD